jgi:prenyltransferase beta subunit
MTRPKPRKETMKKFLLATTLGIAAVVPAQTSELTLAASSVVFVQFCEREYFAMTPLQRDTMMSFVNGVAAKHGKEAVKEATIKEYASGYYSLGDKWCSIIQSAWSNVVIPR